MHIFALLDYIAGRAVLRFLVRWSGREYEIHLPVLGANYGVFDGESEKYEREST